MPPVKKRPPTEVAPAAAPADDPGERDDAPFYCPGCGRRSNYQRECRGSDIAPHRPIEVVSTDELDGDPEEHTAAPDSPGV